MAALQPALSRERWWTGTSRLYRFYCGPLLRTVNAVGCAKNKAPADAAGAHGVDAIHRISEICCEASSRQNIVIAVHVPFTRMRCARTLTHALIRERLTRDLTGFELLTRRAGSAASFTRVVVRRHVDLRLNRRKHYVLVRLDE